MAKTNDQIKVVVEKEFNFSPTVVFDAWVNTSFLSRWMFGPAVRDEVIVSLNNDPVINGTFSYVVKRGTQEINHHGKYMHITRPTKLVFTWNASAEDDGTSIVEISITATSTGCKLVLIHYMDRAWADYKDRTQAGWTFMINKLESALNDVQ